MYRDKTFLAISPARSGSKGLQHKNIKLLNNKPMMAYTIEAFVKSQVFDEIIVSTDNERYAEIARQYGASVPMLRPKQRQPTSPLRDEKDILESIELLFEKNAKAIISMCEVDHPVKWTAELNQNLCLYNDEASFNRY